MIIYNSWLKPENFKVVGFYPYTSSTINRIYTQSHNCKTEEHDFLTEFGNAILDKAIELGCSKDNKIVVEIEFVTSIGDFRKTSNLFVGFYDGIINIGLGVYQPDEYTQKYNQFFN